MAKVVNIKWETDGYEVDLPNEFEIPERFIDENGVDEDAVSDWLSDVTGWLHSGFDIQEVEGTDLLDSRFENLEKLEDLVGRRFRSLEELKARIEDLTGRKVGAILESESEMMEETDYMIDYEFELSDIHTMYYLKDNAGNYYITEV